jgi:EmrB/QacA subfamily drug resistance transporter
MTASPEVTPDPRRWKALALLGAIQFMLVLDITVVNVALPNIQHDLGFSRAGLAWVVNGYVLMAGGLLLLGGRLADIVGRRRLFLLGVGLFAVASATCGAAQDPGMLVVSRFVQGAGEAFAAPASLGLIAVLFPDPAERVKALGMWGGIAGLGGTSGTVISGALVNYASWRWIFFVNIPVAAIALILTPRLVSESRMVLDRQDRPDYYGATTMTAGLIALVDGVLNAANHPWGGWQVLVPLFGGLALLGATGYIEAHSKSPLIPLTFFRNRTRVATNIVTLFFSSGFFTYFFLLTLFEQQVLHYSPIRSGLSYLPFGICIGIGIGLGTALMPKLGVKTLLTSAFVLCAVGMTFTSNIDVTSHYVSGIVPGMVILALGSGICFPAIGNASLHQVTGQDSSLASGVQSAMQQIGGAIGLSFLVTLGLRHATAQIHRGTRPPVAYTHGYALAYHVAIALLAAGAVFVVAFFEKGVLATPRNPEAEVADAVPAPA